MVYHRFELGCSERKQHEDPAPPLRQCAQIAQILKLQQFRVRVLRHGLVYPFRRLASLPRLFDPLPSPGFPVARGPMAMPATRNVHAAKRTFFNDTATTEIYTEGIVG